MSSAAGTLTLLAGELARLFEPLGRRAEDNTAEAILDWLGLAQPDAIAGALPLTSALTTTVSAAASLPDLIDALADAVEREDAQQATTTGRSLIEQIRLIVSGAREVAAALEGLSTSAAGLTPSERAELAAFAATFAGRLLSHLMVEYVETRFPQLEMPFLAAGAIEIVRETGAGALRVPHIRKTFHFDRVAKLVSDPQGLLRDVYGWGEPGFDGVNLFSAIRWLLEDRFAMPVQVLQPPGGPAILEAFALRAEVNPALSPPGIDVNLRFPADVADVQTIDAGDWQMTIDTRARFATDVAAIVRPLVDIEVDPASGDVDVAFSVNTTRRSEAALGSGYQDFRIDYVNGRARSIGGVLVENIGELNFVLVTRHITDVRRTDDVFHQQQGMSRVQNRFLFVDVNRRHAGAPRAQSVHQGTRLDQRCATGIDQQSCWLHASEVSGGDYAACRLHEAHV